MGIPAFILTPTGRCPAVGVRCRPGENGVGGTHSLARPGIPRRLCSRSLAAPPVFAEMQISTPSPLAGPDWQVVRYHSLEVPQASLPACLQATAWALAPPDEAVMAVSHRTLPYHGVQFHPESVATGWGPALLRNFLVLAHEFHGLPALPPPPGAAAPRWASLMGNASLVCVQRVGATTPRLPLTSGVGEVQGVTACACSPIHD